MKTNFRRQLMGTAVMAAIPGYFFGWTVFWVTFIALIYYTRNSFSEARVKDKINNEPGFFSSAGKNLIGGAMLGKGLSDKFMSKGVGKRHFRCGNCGFEKVALVSPNPCPKCKSRGRSLFIEL